MDQIATDIGSRLRQAREQRGLTLKDIAATTKISMPALLAMEHNHFDRLPGGVFRRAYVRAVADVVGLDADGLVREYLARFERDASPVSRLEHRADWRRRLRLRQRLPAALVAIVGVLLCGSLFLERDVVRPAADERQMANAIAGSGAPSLRLEMRANGPSWVTAVADGERVVDRLMEPGEGAVVEAHIAITLRVGDAGAITYSLNGVTAHPPGSRGEAATIRITRDNLERQHGQSAGSDALDGRLTGI